MSGRFTPKELFFNQFKEALEWQSIRYYTSITSLPSEGTPSYMLSVGYYENQHSWLEFENATLDQVVDGIPFSFRVRPKFPTEVPDGNYSCTIHLEVGFTWPTGEFQTEDFASVDVYLEVKAGILNFSFEPKNALLKVVKSIRQLPSLTVDITTSNNVDISGDAIFKINDSLLPYRVNTSEQAILKPDIKVLDYPAGVNDYVLTYLRNGEAIGYQNIKLLVTNSADLDVFPSTLNFKGTQGKNTIDSQIINIYSNEPHITIHCPEWVTCEKISDDNGFSTWRISAKYDYLVGYHIGVIIVSSSSAERTVDVTFNLSGIWNQEFNKNYHFTQDGDLLKISKSTNESSFIRLKINIRVYNFGGSSKEYLRHEDLPFFSGVAQKDIGSLIHRLLEFYTEQSTSRFYNLARTNAESKQYKYTSVSINIQELEFDTLKVLNSISIPMQYYLQGKSPKRTHSFMSQKGFYNILLSNRLNTLTPISKNGVICYNYIKNNAEQIEILINGLVVQYETNASIIKHVDDTPDVNIFGGLLYLKNIAGVKPNDIIDVIFSGEKQSYFIMKEKPKSINLFYRNTWGLIDVAELTGEHEMESRYTRTTNDEFDGWTEKTNTLAISKKQRIKINSGFILKDNTAIIHELLMSEICWFYLNETKISGRIVSEKIINKNTADNLLNFELEFEINDTNYGDFYQ